MAKEGLPGGREEEKKNALAITYSPRSGSEITVRGRHDEDPRLTQRLYRYADLLRTEEVPTKAVYELWTLLQEAEEFHLSEEALLAEARRILGRKAMEKAYREELGLRLEGKVGLMRLVQELLLARPFAEALEQAAIPVEKWEVWSAH